MKRWGQACRESGIALRYLCVGSACFGMNWTLMLLIDKDRYILSSAVCLVVSGTFAYACHSLWTFKTPINAQTWAAYLVGLAPSYPVSLALLALLHDLLRIELRQAIPAATLLMLGINYGVARMAIYRRSFVGYQIASRPRT